MRVLKFADIRQLEPGEVIPSFRATIKKLYKFESKPDSKNPGQTWSYQFAVLAEGGDEIKCSFKNQPEFGREWEGAVIVVSCNQGDRGMTGIKRDIDDYDKKNIKPMISVTATAKIDEERGGANQAPAQAAPAPTQTQRSRQPEPPPESRRQERAPAQESRPATQQTRQPAPQNEPAAPQNTQTTQQRQRAKSEETPLKEQLSNYYDARKFAMRSANAMRINLNAAMWLADAYKKEHGLELSPEGVRAFAITMAIEMAKKIGIGMLPAMPLEDLLQKIEVEAKSQSAV